LCGNVNVWGAFVWGAFVMLDTYAVKEECSARFGCFGMMTCLNGYYRDVLLDSLGESLWKAERGGR